MKAIKQDKISKLPQESISGVLRYAMLKVGLRAANLPNYEETQILMAHVVEYYGTHTVDEVRLAFDMSISGKLDVEVNCYENFSCLYFSSIMNAYRKWAAQAYVQVSKEPQRYEEKQLGVKVHWGGEINWTYQQIKSGKFINYQTFPIEFYTQMVEDGLIEPPVMATDDYKRKIVFMAFETAIAKNMEAIYERSGS